MKKQINQTDSNHQSQEKVEGKTSENQIDPEKHDRKLCRGGWCASYTVIPYGKWCPPETEIPKGGWR